MEQGAVIAPPAAAKQALSSNRLRQLGVALLTHANATRGQFPKTLGKLYTSTDVGAEAFFVNRDVPATVREGKQGGAAAKEAAETYIDENSDFVYLAGSLTEDAPATAVLAHTKPSVYDGRAMDLLFADGHVEHLPMEAAKARLGGAK